MKRTVEQCRPDCIFHLSSLANGRPDLALVEPIFNAELVACVHVLTAAAELGVRRLVLPGSLEEPDPGVVPSSPYAAAKAASHLYSRMFHLLYRVPVVTARIFMAYGPGQPQWKLIPAVANALPRGVAPEIASPSRAVDWIYVSDVVDGLLRLAEVEGLEGQMVDIGSGDLTTIRDLVTTLCELSRSSANPVFASAPMRPFERVARADADLTEHVLGWRPQVALRGGLMRTLDALQCHDRDETLSAPIQF